jgi:hypothetical protein
MNVQHFLGFLFHPLFFAIFFQPQALSLLVALILRATVSTRRQDFDDEEEYDIRSRSREPLLNPQSGQTSGSSKGDIRGNHSDVWSSRMREKV